MKVFVTGATGFVGGHLLQALTRRGHEITCLVRSTGRLSIPAREVVGDATRPEGLAEAMAGMEAAIHLVGIIREFPARGITFHRLHVEATRNVVAAARQAGVARYLHMSSNGARPDAPSLYHRSKWEAEELVRASGLPYTIFRPSVIFGPGGGFVNLLADMIRRSPVVPVVGNGRYLLQPVSVATVAEGFALALERPQTAGESFEVCGPDRLTYNRVLDLIGEAVGRGHPAKLHLPVWLMRAAAAGLGRFPWFPVTPDQLTMLFEGNLCGVQTFYETFGLEPVHLAGALGYLRG
jgi:uncharacterized protein YbjT (DUF2867 family)